MYCACYPSPCGQELIAGKIVNCMATAIRLLVGYINALSYIYITTACMCMGKSSGLALYPISQGSVILEYFYYCSCCICA